MDFEKTVELFEKDLREKAKQQSITVKKEISTIVGVQYICNGDRTVVYKLEPKNAVPHSIKARNGTRLDFTADIGTKVTVMLFENEGNFYYGKWWRDGKYRKAHKHHFERFDSTIFDITNYTGGFITDNDILVSAPQDIIRTAMRIKRA